MTDYFWFESLKQSIRRNKRFRENRYFQISTIGLDSSPANRTVVFRGFTKDSDSIKVITDSRSKKLEEIKVNALCEICWYFSVTREQFRIRAKAEIFDQPCSNERHVTWSELSESAKEQFFWTAPGRPIESTVYESKPDLVVEDGVPETFVLLELQPTAVDHLQLKGSPQTRILSSVNSGVWVSSAVHP